MRKIITAATVVALSLLSAACGGGAGNSAEDTKVVVVSIPQLVPLVEAVGGDGFEVVTVLDGNSDPEMFEPSPDVMAKVAKADLYISAGTLPFECYISSALPDRASRLAMSEHIAIIRGTHGNELEVDPHIWLSLRNQRIFAPRLSSALSALVPDSAAVYHGRMESLCMRLDSLDRAVDSMMVAAGRPAFGIWHPSLSYFARDYGLSQISVGAEHRELTPMQIRDAIDRLRSGGVRIVFYEYPGQRAAAIALAESAGASLVEIPVANPDCGAIIDSVSHAISSAVSVQ